MGACRAELAQLRAADGGSARGTSHESASYAARRMLTANTRPAATAFASLHLTRHVPCFIDNESHLQIQGYVASKTASHPARFGLSRACVLAGPHAGMPPLRSHWLQHTRVRVPLHRSLSRAAASHGLRGNRGVLRLQPGVFRGLGQRAAYLASVAGSLVMFATSVLIARLGDPYELRRSECQRAFAMQPSPQPVTMSGSRVRSGPDSSPAGAAMN